MQRRYLFTLEITPLEVGKTYPELPSHLTLISRFLSDLSANELASMVQPTLHNQTAVPLHFTTTTQLGSKKLTVHMVDNSEKLRALHRTLLDELRKLDVAFEYPQFIGTGHKPHVTKREGDGFAAGNSIVSSAVYLIEIVHGARVVRSKLSLPKAL